MTLQRNKDTEIWDDETGFVYNEDGTVLRPGLVRLEPLAKTTVAGFIRANPSPTEADE